jgi:hypothetical protein
MLNWRVGIKRLARLKLVAQIFIALPGLISLENTREGVNY